MYSIPVPDTRIFYSSLTSIYNKGPKPTSVEPFTPHYIGSTQHAMNIDVFLNNWGLEMGINNFAVTLKDICSNHMGSFLISTVAGLVTGGSLKEKQRKVQLALGNALKKAGMTGAYWGGVFALLLSYSDEAIEQISDILSLVGNGANMGDRKVIFVTDAAWYCSGSATRPNVEFYADLGDIYTM